VAGSGSQEVGGLHREGRVLLGPVAEVLHMGERCSRGPIPGSPRDCVVLSNCHLLVNALPCAERVLLHMEGYSGGGLEGIECECCGDGLLECFQGVGGRGCGGFSRI